ncbi:MAG TPA: Trk system potassium transporter TrkA [Candidatus Avibacteroides excrementipullorum]|jgi:trk system potassium uptake protein TrkA|nr:Trk system potassium transporter TrkA [Candidatus Avibacteroides excrementipullorum]
MKIIIAGAGSVGTHLSTLLSKEQQEIIVIDNDEERLSNIDPYLDIMTVQGAPTSISTLKNAGIKDADLFIGVTPDESSNMTACLIAKSLGAKKTIARIDNYEYLLPKQKEFFLNLGIDSLIYPEMLAAKEIVSSLKISWIRQSWEFGGGALLLFGSKVRENAPILDIKLEELKKEVPFHIVAIKRGNETIIPRGYDCIKLYDIVYITTTRENMPYLKKLIGKENYKPIENVIIMGGSRIAMRTTQYAPENMHMTIVENNYDKCMWLNEHVNNNVLVIKGDGRDLDLLKSEGLKTTDAFIALTGSSETNILACLAAKKAGVRKTIAEVENIDYIGMAESLDIGSVINKKKITAGHIYQMMLKADVSNVKSLTFASADVAEFTITKKAKVCGQKIKDAGFPKGINIGGIIRDGKGIIADGNTVIQENDHIVVFCTQMMLKKIEKFFR